MTSAIAYCSIAGVAIAAYLGISWPAVVIGVIALSSISIADNLQFRQKLATAGKLQVLHTANLSAVGAAAMASGAAYAAGAIMRLLAPS